MIDSDQERLVELVGAVSRETFQRLRTLSALVFKWAPRINLIGLSTADDIWRRHVLDSAQLVPLAKPGGIWADLGSGAGFPGLVVAVLMAERGPSTAVHLVESNRKKAVFLQIAAGELGLPQVTVHSKRIETIVETLQPTIVSARALAPLPALLKLVERPLGRGAAGIFHKGREYLSETAEADSGWRFDMVMHPNRVSPDGVILEISNLRRRPEAG